ncbi:MAG TPA: DUF1223 domain-containing protein [Caulobacteraceae bacterium]|jgi:hypothetical protein|nr:DUF1223 domain-containing protein [Caulobacteraceae bacterium]
MSIRLLCGRGAAALALVAAAAAPALAADARHPTVVELFQSQGCSSCPPANANAIALSGRPDLLVLSFGVTYWDQLGWKDTFASPQYTQRQWDYAHALRHADVWTPQVVVNGRADDVGVRRDELEALIGREDRGAGGPVITVEGDRVAVGAAPARRAAEVLLVRYDPNIVQVPISRGENSGRTLPHKNVVKALVRLGSWTGAAEDYRLPATAPGLKSALLIQDGPGGAILAAARL